MGGEVNVGYLKKFVLLLTRTMSVTNSQVIKDGIFLLIRWLLSSVGRFSEASSIAFLDMGEQTFNVVTGCVEDRICFAQNLNHHPFTFTPLCCIAQNFYIRKLSAPVKLHTPKQH